MYYDLSIRRVTHTPNINVIHHYVLCRKSSRALEQYNAQRRIIFVRRTCTYCYCLLYCNVSMKYFGIIPHRILSMKHTIN